MIRPYYQDAQATIFCGDCKDVLPLLADESVDCVLTDPPYNVGYTYEEYSDAMSDNDYFEWQLELVSEYERLMKGGASFLYLHYPEFAARMYWAVPEVTSLTQQEWITWVYNTHTSGKPLRKASRAWIWLSKDNPHINAEALQGQYRNPDDKRVKQLIAQGRRPLDYDWWLVEQVKNVSGEKTDHPCQVPEEIVSRLIRAAAAAKEAGRKCIGIELSERYCEIAAKRLSQGVLFSEAM